MNKLFATIALLSTLLLTGCVAGPDIERILQTSEPTYVNVEKINENSQIFIDKEEQYVLTDNAGLSNDSSLYVDDKEKVFTTIVSNSKQGEKVFVFIGLKTGATKAYILHPDGTKTNFIINVS